MKWFLVIQIVGWLQPTPYADSFLKQTSLPVSGQPTVEMKFAMPSEMACRIIKRDNERRMLGGRMDCMELSE